MAPRPKPPPVTTRPLNAHERLQARYAVVAESYKRGRQPPRPASKSELDVLKEHHQFIRSADQDPASLSWEDKLAIKYYDSLFREFAIVNLKHYRTGAVALRWRTESELLEGIGQLTCASMRCEFHQPSPALVAAFAEDEAAGVVDVDSTQPLVKCRLHEQEMQFGHVEDGERKSALVKVVLCGECGRKLRKGREKAREVREAKEGAAGGDHRRIEAPPQAEEEEEYGPTRPAEDMHRRRDEPEPVRRRSASPPPRRR